MTALSINVNKFALIRNARGADMPNLVDISKKCIEYGANGITVHPRPDERHVKFSDLQELKNLTSNYDKIEFNIEGYPSDDFIKRVINISPDQVTLVPDPPEALTSSFGWDCEKNKISVPKHMIGSGEHYALQIEGDSMIGAGILDGDTAIIKKADDAYSGEIIVALIDGEEATLKRLRKKGETIALEPSNSAYETKIYGPDRVQVQGTLVGILRSY